MASCIEWKLVIQTGVDFMLYDKGKMKFLNLQLYTTQKREELSLAVISMQKSHSTLLGKRFAMSLKEPLMLPHHYQLPVECKF